VVCVGETLAQREAGQTEAVSAPAAGGAGCADGGAGGKIVLAYEPVWAIGTGKTATPQMAQAAHSFLRARLAQKDAAAAPACRFCTAAA
jgi:triosephosphate isomerase